MEEFEVDVHKLKSRVIPYAMKKGLKNLKRKHRKEWWKKHWKCILLLSIGVLSIVGIVLLILSLMQMIKLKQTATVRSIKDWNAIDDSIRYVIIPDNSCNTDDFTSLNLAHLTKVKTLTIGDTSLAFVSTVNIISLPFLESVVIGKNSLTNHPYSKYMDINRHFYLKDCKTLKELRIGSYSFSDYYSLSIDNNPSLEVIEIGDRSKYRESSNFYYASLVIGSMHASNGV